MLIIKLFVLSFISFPILTSAIEPTTHSEMPGIESIQAAPAGPSEETTTLAENEELSSSSSTDASDSSPTVTPVEPSAETNPDTNRIDLVGETEQFDGALVDENDPAYFDHILFSSTPLFFVGIVYFDNRLQYEYRYSKELSLVGGLTYKIERFPDARKPYRCDSIGPNLSVRYYLPLSFFISGGLEFWRVKLLNTKDNIAVNSNLPLARVLFGAKIKHSEKIFFESGLGVNYYAKNVYDRVNESGYRKSVYPSLHLGIAIAYE